MLKSNNILEFIGTEHQNELISVANLKGEFGYLQELDEIYQEVNHAFSINANNDVHYMVSTMYLQAHSEFYIGMSQYLKSHLGKTFLSLRIAIDASFNAYYFTKNPKNIRDFLDEKTSLHKKVAKHIKEYLKNNAHAYPLAQNLVKVHELASSFFAHSSIQSIAYKHQVAIDAKGNAEEVLLNYFDSLGVDIFLAYYFALLKGFFMVFQLFYNCFYKKEFRIEYPDRDRRIATFESKLNLKGKQYPLKQGKEKKTK